MRSAFLFLTTMLIYNVGSAQYDEAELPYRNGEKALKSELKSYIGERIRSNDSAAVYYIEIKRSKEGQAYFEITGSNENDSLTQIVKDFFKGSLQNWEPERMIECGVIVPLYILSVCEPGKNSDIEWANLTRAKLPGTKRAIFVSPLVVTYICRGEPCGDKNEIKRN